MNIKRILSIGIAGTLLSACSATGTQFAGFTPPAEGQSKIYVYRPSAFKGGGVHYDVHANDQLIGHIRNGGYISKELIPGDYEIWAKTEARRSVQVPLRPNETQCVKASVGFGAFVGRPKLEWVPMEKCETEIRSTVQSAK